MSSLMSAYSAIAHSAIARAEVENATVAALGLNQYWGIPLALIGAAMLSFGAQYQSRGLNKVERITGKSAGSGLSLQHVIRLLKRPSWIMGTALLGLAIVFQLASLSIAPLMLVQPIGVAALVITAVLNSRLTGVRLPKRAMAALAMCVAGIVTFVTVAAFTAADRRVTHEKLVTILILFAITLAVVLTLYVLWRYRAVALFYIVGAGVLYGFVVTFAKAVLGRLQQGEFDWLTWACVGALLIGALIGMVFVQNAYSSGPPDLVIAGLTVIDPLIAVLIGIAVLNEAAGASGLAIFAFVIAGLIAVAGVLGLAKYHPQTGRSVLDEAA